MIVYGLLQCDLGAETDIIKEIAEIPNVKEVGGTYGIYDIFCKVESGDAALVDEAVIARIRRIRHIRSTLTLHRIPSQGGKG